MQENKFWLKFVITGKPQDYLTYINNCKEKSLAGGEVYAHNNRRPCDKGNQCKR